MQINDWVELNKGNVFRILVYKKVWTPYEIEKAYSDESEYENGGYYTFGYITNAIEIQGDVMLEIAEVVQEEDGSWSDDHRTHYELLSDISLTKFDIDNEDLEEEQYEG